MHADFILMGRLNPLPSVVTVDRTFPISGKKFAEARKAAGLKQMKLAILTGRSVRWVAGIEGTDVTNVFLDMRDKLSTALRIPEDELIKRLAPDPDPVPHSAAELKRQMAYLGWSAQELAKKSGVHVTVLAPILAGTAPINEGTGKRLAKAIGDGVRETLLEQFGAGDDKSEEDDEDEGGGKARKTKAG
jgi:transcriptional regulator with XRE-family HTH domain